MLTVHFSNRLETLASALAALTRDPLSSPFASEIVVVQSRGVARWLSLRLADAMGVCANVRFPFPNAYSWELYRALSDASPEHSLFDTEILAWRIEALLPALEEHAAFGPVNRYVRRDPLRRHELATRLAGVFEQYLVYRSDWIESWERGRDTHWQAELWRRLVNGAGAAHRAALHRKLLSALAGERAGGLDLPERVSIFGAPALAPSQLELFAAVAQHTEVHLFIQNPCREYWGDIAAAGDIARKALAKKPQARLLDTGNSLLASLGKQGRDFIDLVTALDCPLETKDHFVEPGEASLLAAIQSDILDLRERRGRATVLARDDRSIQIHCCHSAMREAEVLHDQLLALFAAHRDLEPSQVVVMTPDIERYAPYIEAVFSTAEPRIPFNISDRTAEHQSTLAAAFMALLALAGSRYDANRVLAILDESVIRRRYGLSESDVEIIQRWVHEAQIRWGIDGGHRARLGLPPAHEHTWRFGLDRLLLGLALPGGGADLFNGVLPYDEVEGSLGDVLGRFKSFAEAAMALDAELAGARTLMEWCGLLRRALARFFDPERGREHELEAIHTALGALEAEARLAQYTENVPVAVVRSALRARLEVPGRAFLSGGVTFCAMMPMRSLPFEVVCMIGMNDGAFPRMRRPYGFDLMGGDFRKGDRSRRDDDRYLFLESLLCARRCLYVSYTGRNIRDDSVIPPCVLVSELSDYVAQGFRTEDGVDVREHLFTVHPLQPFSRRYFDARSSLFSHSTPLCRAAAVAGTGSRSPSPLLGAGLPDPETGERTVDLESLLAFFRNPAKYLLERRLGIRLESADEEVGAREPFVLDALTAYELRQRLLGSRLSGEPYEGFAVARAGGMLPHGVAGEVLFDAESAAVDRYARSVAAWLPRKLLEPLSYELMSGDVRFTARLAGVSAAGLTDYRVADIKPNDRVRAWVRHLVLNACAPPGVECVTRCIGQDVMITYAPVEHPEVRLDELLQLYRTGVCRPLHFFPKAACAYVKAGEINYVVNQVWLGSEFSSVPGEAANPYYQLAFRGSDPLDHEFKIAARTVFGPMFAASHEEPLE
jgi:exodeoxyribonuclease V gamma subunit